MSNDKGKQTFSFLKGKEREKEVFKKGIKGEKGKIKEKKRTKKDLVHFEQGPNFLL